MALGSRLSSWRMPINASRVRLERFARAAGNSIAPGSRVLDAGAGDSPYRDAFSQHIYESADFGQVTRAYASDLTYVTDLSSIPVEDGRYDLVFITQVLEHLPHPAKVLREMHRVLKPGGQLWLSAPLFYEEHDQPYDFFRYTRFALDILVREAGFQPPRVKWLEGYLMTVAYQLDVASRALRGNWRALRRPLLWLSGGLARMDLVHTITDRGHPKNYTVVAIA
jgi:SAM-dependent methyltransferase